MISVAECYTIQPSLSNNIKHVTSNKADSVNDSPNNKSGVNSKEDVNKNKTEFKYKCNFCEQPFKRKDRLDRHLFIHTKQKTYCCDVEGCSNQYTNNSHLNRHKKTSHEAKPEIASVLCKQPNCHQTFTNRSNMNRHYQTHHVNILPYACSQCSEKFRRKLQLKKHEILKHTGKYAYTCSHCSKGFLNQFTFFRHLTTHNVEKQRPCPDCGAIFLKWSALVEHRRKSHKNVLHISCDLCDKTFSRKNNIKQHIKIHLLTEANIFPCTYDNCPKYYIDKRNLTSHIRSKHEGKQWICDQCHRHLSTFQKLKQHIMAHLDTKRAPLLVKKSSTISKLIGIKLPDDVEQKILKGNCSQVAIGSFLPPAESTHETSATELSDF